MCSKIHHEWGNAIVAMKGLLLTLEKNIGYLTDKEMKSIFDKLYEQLARIDSARFACIKKIK